MRKQQERVEKRNRERKKREKKINERIKSGKNCQLSSCKFVHGKFVSTEKNHQQTAVYTWSVLCHLMHIKHLMKLTQLGRKCGFCKVIYVCQFYRYTLCPLCLDVRELHTPEIVLNAS